MGIGGQKHDSTFGQIFDPLGLFSPGGLLGGPIEPPKPPKAPEPEDPNAKAKKAKAAADKAKIQAVGAYGHTDTIKSNLGNVTPPDQKGYSGLLGS